MSDTTKRDNSGALFKAKPSDNPKWPQYEGSCLIGGVDYWISAWVKEGKSGKFFSLAFKPKEARSQPARTPNDQRREDDADSIPF
jgi:hypothetical protein